MDKLNKSYTRRIEKIITSDRPNIAPVGTNHIKNSELWTANTTYKGELSINMTSGELFTQDGKQPIHIGKENSILSGLVISTSGVSLREINISNGKVSIKKRVYKYNSTDDIDDATVYIDNNIETFSRLDAICVKGDITVYDLTDEHYGVDFKVFKGAIASNIPAPIIDDDYILLGLVLVKPNQTEQDVLRPLSVGSLYSYPIFPTTPEKFINDVKTRIWRWQPNTLYFENQTVQFDNNLYRVAYTQVSGSDLTADFANDKLISLGAVTNSNVSRFSHIGSSPTTESFANLFFNTWNSNTRILDAFADISKFINRFAPVQPLNIANANIKMINSNVSAGISIYGYGVSNIANVVIKDTSNVTIESSDKFVPYDSGALKSYLYTPLTSYSTSNISLSNKPNTLPNIVSLTDGSSKYTFTVKRDDHYTEQGYKGFYNSIYANAKTLSNLTPSSNSYKFNFTHLSSTANTELIFYVENSRTPNISNVSSFTATSRGNVKYLSGVPILKQGDSIKFYYDISNAVRYFYNYNKLSNVKSETFISEKIINFANVEILTPSNRPPFSELANSNVDGVVVKLANVECNISANAIVSEPQFTIRAFNPFGEYVESITSPKAFLVDDISEEVGVRLFSGDGTYPSGTANVNWGNVYTTTQSQANILSTQELQYFGRRYFYPKINYSSNVGVINSEDSNNLIAYPNYTNSSTLYRWATFKLGNVTAQKYYNFYIRNANGLDYALTDGVTVSPNVKVFLKVHNSSNIDAGTGWVDMNKAYNSTLISNPVSDGDPALDLGWMESNPEYRRATFGTEPRTGNVYVRFGTDSRSISFQDIVKSNTSPETTDSLWDEYDLGSIVGESYVIIKINGTNNTVLSDFLNGTTMSSHLDLQVRVKNDTTPTSSTDWVDANESYPANSFKPADYNDPALDLTYYEGGIPDATVRKITFGPTTKTGNLTARIRVVGTMSYSNISLIYPN